MKASRNRRHPVEVPASRPHPKMGMSCPTTYVVSETLPMIQRARCHVRFRWYRPRRHPPAGAPRTRTDAIWFGLCVAALLAVVLIVFALQNTSSVRVDFLSIDGSLPLVLALLFIGAALLTMALGAAGSFSFAARPASATDPRQRSKGY